MRPRIATSVLDAIGRTPLIRLHRVVAPKSADVLVKLESTNPTGSYKDRMALAMVEGAEARGALTPGMRVVADEPGTFWADQFHNEDAIAGYAGIGRELLEQTGDRIDAFCGAVGTGGMLIGVVRALREGGCPARIVALDTGLKYLAGDLFADT